MSIGLNIAMAENACENGVEFKFDTKVQKLEKRMVSGKFTQIRVCSRQNMW